MADQRRAALVTGGAKRLGRIMVLELARLGFGVCIHYHRSQAEAEATVAEIKALGGRAVALATDLTGETPVGRLVEDASAAIGPLDLLVNNAAIFEFDRLEGWSRDRFRRHQKLNLEAPIELAQAFARQVPEGADAQIVNMIDQRAINPTASYLSYAVSKSGLWGATQVLARDLAPETRVNAVGPGFLLEPPDGSEPSFAKRARQVPLGRPVDPDDLARALRFLIETRSVTGQMICLDGGMHMGWLSPGMGEP
ncbi:MAG: SDR family oxidoreductase [Geminicoccaceae bacterium]